MTPQQKLVAFMQAKQGILVDNGLCKPGEYFNSEDEQELLMWKDRVAQSTWNELLERALSGLGGLSCPWCRAEKCPTCGYGKRHGVCSLHADIDEEPSTWQRITQKAFTPERDIRDILGAGAYRDIIKRIEREESDENSINS